MKIENANNYRHSIIELLDSEKLPTADLPESLENFIVAFENDVIAGVAGLEIYDAYALLRSLAVRPEYRNRGIADKLLLHIDALAVSKELTAILLLTETAPGYFERKGYQKISRAEVPAQVQQSSEFSYVCPQSAIVMKKVL